MSPFGCSLHLLFFDESFAYDLVDCRFHERLSDCIILAVSFAKVGYEVTVIANIRIELYVYIPVLRNIAEKMSSTKIGYCRVSKIEQTMTSHLELLRKAD